MGLETEITNMWSTSLASLAYFFLVFFSVLAALLMSWKEWQRTRSEQARRLMLAMTGLTLVRVVYLVAGLVSRFGWTETWVLLPPLGGFVDAASICMLGWAFMPPSKRNARAWDLVFGATLALTALLAVVLTISWNGRTQAEVGIPNFNFAWEATAWTILQMALIALAIVAVVRDREEGWGTFLAAMVVMFAGRVLQLAVPFGLSNLRLWEWLTNMVAYPLIAIAVYQNIFGRMRVHSMRWQDISQASLDQIKSLLYLFEASQAMSSSLDLQTVLDNTVKGISRALDADQCAIAFPEEKDAGQMRLVAIHNPGRQGRGEGVSFPLEYQLTVQHAMRRKKHVIGEESDNVQLKVLFALLGSSAVGPLLVQPLIDNGESIGAVIVGNALSRRPFTPNEAKLCQSMAEQVVGAIRNARRYSMAQEQLGKLNKELADNERLLGEAQEENQKLAQKLDAVRTDLEAAQEQTSLSRKVRNALEIKLVSTRAEADTFSERLAVLESDLGQAHANSEAQLRWHEEEIDRRQAAWEEEANASKWLRTVLQGMTAGILITDEKGLIQEANVAAQILLEQEGAQLRGIALEDVSDEQRWTQAVAAARGGEAVRLSSRVGSNTLMCDVSPLKAGAQQRDIEGLVVILQDVSTESEAQRDQLQTVALVAQEMRTPMTAIINYVDLLLSEAVGSIGDAQHKFLLRIKAAAERMIQMTNDIASGAGVREPWTMPNREEVDMGKLIESAVAGTCTQLEDKGIDLDVELPGDLPSIAADPDYLQRVLTNLLSNACLASEEGGRVEVWASESGNLPFDPDRIGQNGAGFVVVSVKDAGGGLSDDALSRVFDRGRPSRTPDGLGESGAGLALVKTLVEAHGGRLWVESENGVGTTFSFVLPVKEQEGHSPAEKPTGEEGTN